MNKLIYSPLKPFSTMKLCVNCKHYNPVLFSSSGICKLIGEIDISNGIKRNLNTDIARTICGKEASFYEEDYGLFKKNIKIPIIAVDEQIIQTFLYVFFSLSVYVIISIFILIATK